MNEFIETLKVGGSIGGSGGIAYFALNRLYTYLIGRNKVEEKEAEAQITESETIKTIVESSWKPMESVSKALVSVVETGAATVTAIGDIVTSLNEFRLNSVKQHADTRTLFVEQVDKQSDTLAQTFKLIHQEQKGIVKALQSIHGDKKENTQALLNIENEVKKLSDTMSEKDNNGEMLILLQAILAKIEGLDMKVSTFTGDMRKELDDAKREVETIKRKVTQEVPDIQSTVNRIVNERGNPDGRPTTDRDRKDRTDNPPTARTDKGADTR